MRYFKDPWLQVFGFLALASGVMAAQHFAPGFKSSPPATASPVVKTAAPLPQPEPARTLKSKAPGKWVVDAALAMDADTAKLGEALANAAAGDTIYVRAGNYGGGVAQRDVAIVGLGAQRDIVVDGDQEGPTFAVNGAKVSIKNVTISHSGTRPGKAVESRRAALELASVAIKAGPQDSGIDAIGGSLASSYGTISGGHRGLDAHDEAKVTLDHMTITKAETGVYLQGASAQITESFLSDDKHGLDVAEQARATVSNGEFSRDSLGVWANRGGQAKVSASRFMSAGAGVLADERGRAEIESCAFSDMTGSALSADSGGEVLDKGSTILRDKAAAATARGQGTLALVETQIEDGQADGADVVDGASAVLSGAKIVRNAGAGLSLRDARAVRLERTTIARQKKCGIEVSATALSVKSSTLMRNDCGVAFLGKASLDADDSDLSGNAKGPFLYDAAQKDGIVVRGKNNNPRNLSSLIQ